MQALPHLPQACFVQMGDFLRYAMFDKYFKRIGNCVGPTTCPGGSGAAVAEQTFRLMDPDSQRMMGLRADTTPQVARIATTRLANAPRPLRLSYAGQCLRVRGSQLAPDRQIAQTGIELIGRCDKRIEVKTAFVMPTKQQVEDQLFQNQISTLARRYLRDLKRGANIQVRDDTKPDALIR